MPIILTLTMMLAGRMHGWGGFTGCKWIARLIVMGAYAYPVYLLHGLYVALFTAVIVFIAFVATHGRWFTNHTGHFALKGFGIAVVPAFLLLDPWVLVASVAGWGGAYLLAKRFAGYDKTQEGKFYAPGIWTWWGEIGSLGVASLALWQYY